MSHQDHTGEAASATPPRAPTVNRRTFLKTATLTTAAAATASASRPVAASDGTDLDAWFENVDNFDGVEDRRGAATVTVTVGAQGNGGPFGFGPAAVRVDPGTTVTWEWSGEGGLHNVVASDGAYGSDLQSEAGATFEHTFEEAGVSTYVCEPHEPMGMKGAVVVGDAAVSAGTTEQTFDYGDWFDDVDNFAGTVDATGQEEVTITVGAPANGGAFGFEPAAVHVDSGTTVVWKWSGEGGAHDVVDPDEGYASDRQSDEGATFARRFDGDGISTYACTPHESVGMKGAVVVGDPVVPPTKISEETLVLGGSFLAAFLSPIAFALFLFGRGRDGGERPPADGPGRPSTPAVSGDRTHGARSRVVDRSSDVVERATDRVDRATDRVDPGDAPDAGEVGAP